MKKVDSISHPLQSNAWGEFRKAMGIEVVRINEGQLTFHRIPFTPFTIGYFPKGPKPTAAMLANLAILAKQKNAIFIQLEPNVPTNHESRLPAGEAGITNHDFLRPSHHPLFTKYTFVLDLTKTEEELLKAMHHKTRYNIKIAQKHDVVIKEDNSDTAFSMYLALRKETTHRQGFYAHDETYHRRMWETMKKAGIAHLWTASYQGEILSAWILFYWNDTIYYPYGASSRKHREVMAPNLLLWEIARWGNQHGFTRFDLWGALGKDPDPNDPWYGFHRFKEGYNPTLVEFVGSYDLVIHPVLYFLYQVADRIRWLLLQKTLHF